MTAIITYQGYTLYEWGKGWKSLIGDDWVQFDSAGQWKQYIDIIMKKK